MPELIPAKNTDRELWREDRHDPMDPGNYYSDRVFVTAHGQIGMESGGTAVVLPVKTWLECIHRIGIIYVVPREP